MIELNKIYNEDCLIGSDKIESGSVDLILTDLPSHTRGYAGQVTKSRFKEVQNG